MRRAVWRASPDDPRGGLHLFARWIREVARGQDVHAASARAQGLAFVTAFFTLPVIAGFSVLILLDGWTLAGWPGWTAGLVVLVAVVGLMTVLHDRLWQRPLGTFGRVLPLPLPEGTFPIYVALRYRSSLTGVDEAAASFVDGWLQIDGARTSFSLRYGDGRSEWRRERLKIALPDGTSVVFWPAGDLKIKPNYRGFEEAARRWVSHGLRPPGESILPPLEVHPRMRKGWALATLGSGLLAIASAALLQRVRFDPFGIALVLAAALFTARGGVVVSEHAAAEDQAKSLEGDRTTSLSGP